MTATLDILNYAKSQQREATWKEAQENIFAFIRYYIPKTSEQGPFKFDLDLAAPQQLALLQAVQDGKRYFVICAPRKTGKTLLVAIIACWLVLRNQRYRFFILSGSQDQAKWLYEYCEGILAPKEAERRWIKDLFAQFLDGDPLKSIIRFTAGGWIRYAAASKKQVNAPIADGLAMDEFVLIPTEIVSQAWPMVRASDCPMRFLLSTATPNEANTDAFVDILDEADDMGFVKIMWSSEDCPFLQNKTAKREEDIARFFLSEEMHETQYMGGTPSKAKKIFPKTWIRETFIKPDPKNPGFLLDGTPFEVDPDKRIMYGEGKGSFDWGFDHETVMLEAYRGLNHKIVITKMVAAGNNLASDWGELAEADYVKHNISEWLCDSAGAFQNAELTSRGLYVKKRVFGHLYRGKEWMIGIARHWLGGGYLVIPDIEEFAKLRKQMEMYRRGKDGKPKKGNDDKVDSLLCLLSGWDPAYYDESAEDYKQKVPETKKDGDANKWNDFSSPDKGWLPDSWKNRKEEMTGLPWKK